jgi:ABC-2 type transport system permease protein/oleandomycin transport system permease protein
MVEDAASALRKADIAVSDLGLRRPTLDDVFLQLTGAPPSENGASAEVATGDGRPNPTSPGVPSARPVGLSDDLKLGVIDRFRSMPMARSTVLIGRTTADLVRNVLIILLMIIVGYIIGFRFQAGLPQALACIALVTGFGLALSWIFAFVALTVRGAEAAQSAGFVILFPLVFASSVFVPVSSMPSWLQTFAKVSPVTLTANAARSLALIPGGPSSLAGAIAWIAGLLAVFIPLSVWRYRRMT